MSSLNDLKLRAFIADGFTGSINDMAFQFWTAIVNGTGITQTEIDQLKNIDSVTVDNTQWGFLGNMDQDVISTSNVSFNNMSVDGTLVTASGGGLTISSGEITITTSFHFLDTEASAATDDLDTINGGIQGMRVVFRANSGARTVVLKDGIGNLKLAGDFSLDNGEDTIELFYDGAQWLELSRSDNGA